MDIFCAVHTQYMGSLASAIHSSKSSTIGSYIVTNGLVLLCGLLTSKVCYQQTGATPDTRCLDQYRP